MDLVLPYTQTPFWIQLCHDLRLVYFTYFSLTPHIWAFKLLITSPILYVRLWLDHTCDAALHM